MMYAQPTSGKRAMGVASGILMIIAASFIFLEGLIFAVDGWWWADYWVYLGVLCFVAFALGIVGAVGVFRRTWRYLDLVSAVLLVVTGIVTIFDMTWFALIILILAIVALILMATGWGQFDEPRAMPYPMYPMGMQPGMPMHPQGMPPPGGAPGGQPMPPPPGGGPMGPPMGAGAPPPYPMPPSESGAPPPPVRSYQEEDIVVDIEGTGPDEA
jgi:hypothetical protein